MNGVDHTPQQSIFYQYKNSPPSQHFSLVMESRKHVDDGIGIGSVGTLVDVFDVDDVVVAMSTSESGLVPYEEHSLVGVKGDRE